MKKLTRLIYLSLNLQPFYFDFINMEEKLSYLRKIMADCNSFKNWKKR